MTAVSGIVVLLTGVPAVAVEAAPTAQSAGEEMPSPRVEVSASGDSTRGHVVAHVKIFDLDQGARTMRVEMFKGEQYDAA